MKFSIKVVLISVLVLILILVTGTGIYFYSRSGPKELQIGIRHNLPESIQPAMAHQIEFYRQLNPHIVISTDKTDTPDIIISNYDSEITPPDSTFSSPVLWTGNLWSLAINKKLLEADGAISVGALSEFRSLEDFTVFLDSIHQAGIVPIAVGNSHGWPMALWDQHLSALLNQGQTPASPILGGESSPPASWTILKEWMEAGYFLDEVLNEGWARGLFSVAEGKAAIALMAGNMLSTIPLEKRSDFLFIPFPSDPSSSWVIGNGYYISFRTDREINELQKLVDFLFSPDVTRFMAKETGFIFHSPNESGRHSQLKSWSAAANSPGMREYMKELRHFLY